MRRLRILMSILIVGGLFGISQTFGYFEKTAYCKFDNGNVTVFMKKEDGLSKCQIYLDTVYQLAVQKYNEIKWIRTYIAQGDDVRYRKGVLEEKQSELLKLVNYRVQILGVVSEFESEFFGKYSVALKKSMELYYSDLETQYYILINQNEQSGNSRPAGYESKISNLEQQMWNVNHVLNAKKLDDIMEVIPTYIYLKKQIEGR